MNSPSESPQCTDFASSHKSSSMASKKGETTQPTTVLGAVSKQNLI